MIYVIMAILVVVICYLFVRLFFLKRAICDAGKQLREINKNLKENRIVKLSMPNKEFEEFLVDMNETLQEIRQERVSYTRRENQFKQQIENISHDLRTPLTAMIGYLKIMDISSFGKEEQEDLATVLRKAERLRELVTEFYDFSRLKAQDYPLHPESVDMTRILREALADSYMELEEQQLEVTADIPEQPCFVIANENAIQRVFQNLLQNVKRYAVGYFFVSVQEAEEHVIICFANDTENMQQQDVELMFERFYTLDSARSNGATGLGLTISKELVEQMNGSMQAELEDKMLYIRIRFSKGRCGL